MAGTTVETSVHPISGFVTGLTSALDQVAATPAWSMSPSEQHAALVGLARIQARLDELRLRVLVSADRNDLGAEAGSADTAGWLTQHTHQSRPHAHADLRLAHRLDQDCPATRHALAAGRITTEQARIITHAVTDLPDQLSADDRARAERAILEAAPTLTIKQLRVLARRLIEYVDPGEADRREGKLLEAEERAAHRRTYLTVRDNHDGTSTGRFRIPTLHAAILSKALHAFTSPRRDHLHADQTDAAGNATAGNTTAGSSTGDAGAGTSAANAAETDVAPQAETTHAVEAAERVQAEPPRITAPERLGRGLCELLERLPTDDLPTLAGGTAAVVVTIPLERLLSGLGAAHLDTGQPISAQAARRLACQAGLIPAVLDTQSRVLDLGRRARFHTPAQRLALTVQHGGCLTEHCETPPAWAEIHHPTPWSEGGPTDLTGLPLCRRHHLLAHDTRYQMTKLPTGTVSFHRRT